jgi:hypothetical protein
MIYVWHYSENRKVGEIELKKWLMESKSKPNHNPKHTPTGTFQEHFPTQFFVTKGIRVCSLKKYRIPFLFYYRYITHRTTKNDYLFIQTKQAMMLPYA